MKIAKILKSLSVKEKIFQMFILGFSGKTFNRKNLNIQKAIHEGIGGVILFSENIESYDQTAQLTTNLQKKARIPIFIGIDQEGGCIERTINIKNKINYLSPGILAATKNVEYAEIQADIMSKELNSMRINMNFAPVMDVNTNKKNPVTGNRSFGDNCEKVIKYSKPVYKSFMNNSIIPVIKHFPGHGDTGEDSHFTLPSVNLCFEELERCHIKPFKKAINDGVNAVMVAHVHYKAFDKDILPASLSKNVIKHYLREQLGFKGLVMSDDMVMHGIKNHYESFDACIKGIEAGIDLFIFRNSCDETLKLMGKLAEYVNKGYLSEERINESIERILLFKEKSVFFHSANNII